MAISKGSIISDDDDDGSSNSDISFSVHTSGELVNRLRICFQESDFVAISGRVNEMEEQISEKDRMIQRLKKELERAEREKKEAQNAVEKWKIRFQSRVSELEETADRLMKEWSSEKLSCNRCAKCEKMEVEKQVVNVDESDGEEKRMDSAAAVARISGLASGGSGKIPTKTILIIESDDENASEAANLHQKSHLDVLKRKMAAITTVSDNDTKNMDENLNTDGPQLMLQKITHDESTDALGSASGQNKQETEYDTENILSKYRSNALNFNFLNCNFNFSDDSSSSSSSSDYEDKMGGRKWESESDVIESLMSDNELCMKAVCALYRQRNTNVSSSNQRGFNDIVASRGNTIAKFLIDKDPEGMLRKSVSELLQFDGHALEDCRKIAIGHSKQLFNLYTCKDPTFQP